ncbi:MULTISPECIES: complex I subunit 4 family protein [Marinobacter]|jgi:NADH-quinone oxidoreductase subunit M|uniref:NADH-quinone oxidoreductase subunit M n=1 Tax=Marinobacter salarius TaxID=1420917 RepID=A0ABY1FNB1_9GAMM|nr:MULTISPECIES: NADH-quinone oxidoreductase subunit M [Marinobacter]MBL84662.1 oxidoreductase [Marinobacter sp.]KXJ44166.1 MAG: oxidoreductase [Marinobacter sp. Hex_13]MBS8229415.1 NADH-quinone oxidoreductase subunit M [Marinobacter salarius]OLF85284.1 oxidoreductase [Marinobacter sp. C18]SFL70297.1 NADH dehydrogenase subunit M [Marinobacter salarius]|tara:strand:+ start:4159 stop:5628 length:1470 start_codon:yes stop_codon:yes gene_type:complete
MLPLVSLTLFLPLVGAVLILCLPKPTARTVHSIAIVSAALTLVGALAMWLQGVSGDGFSQVEELVWMPAIGAAYRVGVDGISLPLVLLSAVLFLVSLIYASSLRDRPRAYVALILLLETAAIGTFTALDGILFYVFFEVSLVSMYFMIAGWGHEDRQRAALMFFIYTLLGSLPLLLAILGLYLGSPDPTFDMRAWIANPPLEGAAAMWALIAMLITFAVKIPAIPLHTWLPAAHVQAPTVGSVILAGIMLKFGTYGLVRFALQMTPDALRDAGIVVLFFGVVSAIYGAFAALAQTDLKRLVAYTSINHMGYVIVGVAVAALTLDPSVRAVALDGAVLQMFSHGLVTGALFLLVGMIQERAHTREMNEFGGLLKTVPLLGWFFVLAAFASLGLPGLAHFPAEFQIFLATLGTTPVAVVVILGIAIIAGTFLKALREIFLGEPRDRWNRMPDLSPREILAVAPLLALTVATGVAPSWVLDVIHRTTSALVL